MDDRRRLAFGGVAELYDAARPSYPPALVEDVIKLAPGSPTGRAVEVGAGTGKATAMFASRGVSVLALEPSVEMAALARRNCAGHLDVEVEQVEFERWQPGGVTFPLLFSAQAWHWLSPELRYAKAREVLQDGGVLAAFWNRPDWRACPFRQELETAYRSAAPALSDHGPMHPADSSSPGEWEQWEEEIGGAAGMGQAEVRYYGWRCEYSTEEYLRLLQTHSDHIVLERARREALLGDVGAVLNAHGGRIDISYRTVLCLARAV